MSKLCVKYIYNILIGRMFLYFRFKNSYYFFNTFCKYSKIFINTKSILFYIFSLQRKMKKILVKIASESIVRIFFL